MYDGSPSFRSIVYSRKCIHSNKHKHKQTNVYVNALTFYMRPDPFIMNGIDVNSHLDIIIDAIFLTFSLSLYSHNMNGFN